MGLGDFFVPLTCIQAFLKLSVLFSWTTLPLWQFSSQALPSLGQSASASTWSVVASLDQKPFWLPVSL